MIKGKRSTNRARLDRGNRSPSIYSRTEKISEKPSLRWLFLALFFLFLGLAIYFVFFSGVLGITKVEINNNKYVKKETILAKIGDYKKSFITNQNLLTLYTRGLKNNLEKVEGIKTVQVEKRFPNTLFVKVTEKIPALSWESLGAKYLVDEEGIVFSGFDEKFKAVPNIIDTKNVPVEMGKQVVSPSFCRFVNEVSSKFEFQTGTKIKRIEIPEITEEIRVTTEAGWYVLFDTTRGARVELDNLARVLTETKSKKKKLEYVDLRIDNKIFYK